MNNTPRKQGAFGALVSGLGRALQWRMLVLWAVGLLIPTLVATLPLWQALSERLDHSVYAKQIAARFDLAWMIEVFSPVMKDSGTALTGAGITGIVLALLIAPWLTGMVVASIRAGVNLRFGNLLQFGLREYGRMARMLVWAIIPVGIAFALFGVVSKWADKQAGLSILESGADNAHRIALVVLAVAFVLAHASLEIGRGVIAADPARRSVVKAWWRGVTVFARRPLAVLIVYLGTFIAGQGLALVFAFARTQVSAATTAGFVIGLLLVQLTVAAVAWGRIARLYGMSMLARDAQFRAPKPAKVVVEEAPVPVADASTEAVAVS